MATCLAGAGYLALSTNLLLRHPRLRPHLRLPMLMHRRRMIQLKISLRLIRCRVRILHHNRWLGHRVVIQRRESWQVSRLRKKTASR